jgi:hypothetical protein
MMEGATARIRFHEESIQARPQAVEPTPAWAWMVFAVRMEGGVLSFG